MTGRPATFRARRLHAAACENYAAVLYLEVPVGVHVPVYGRGMTPGGVDVVRDDQQIAVHRQHAAPVFHRPVAVLRSVEVIDLIMRPPAMDATVGGVRPVKWPGWNGLGPTVER